MNIKFHINLFLISRMMALSCVLFLFSCRSSQKSSGDPLQAFQNLVGMTIKDAERKMTEQGHACNQAESSSFIATIRDENGGFVRKSFNNITYTRCSRISRSGLVEDIQIVALVYTPEGVVRTVLYNWETISI